MGNWDRDALDQEGRDKFINYLKEHGYSCSKSRLKLFDLVHSIHHHFDSEELVKIANENKLQISRATIFRNLVLLEEAGFIKKVQFTDRHTHYEHIYGHKVHDHMICVKCGVVVEFFKRSIQVALEEVASEHSFVAHSHKLEIMGHCKKCNPDS
ncbi:MAG: transcriptional repressor [Bdellovibrionales bacterium]|jgi:Fur family transcriptional regulator, ferric uptake regulator|nr:transcriptional repressor [Bdellovibrionales bacterium]MBT3526171.1 transcriptional repressor [Bdellovibrionales bacterium]MBT7668418.1 transcriptional repressor [Bdellovibrionales bacterium]MBT7766098.1 transcriptional repressor [Bdellovibrionales bacterium]